MIHLCIATASAVNFWVILKFFNSNIVFVTQHSSDHHRQWFLPSFQRAFLSPQCAKRTLPGFALRYLPIPSIKSPILVSSPSSGLLFINFQTMCSVLSEKLFRNAFVHLQLMNKFWIDSISSAQKKHFSGQSLPHALNLLNVWTLFPYAIDRYSQKP